MSLFKDMKCEPEWKRVWFRRKKMLYQSFACLFTSFRRTINKWRRLQSEQRESKTERVPEVRGEELSHFI